MILVLYLELTPLSNKIGISPYLITEEKFNKIFLASWNNPGIKNNPFNEIKISLPYKIN